MWHEARREAMTSIDLLRGGLLTLFIAGEIVYVGRDRYGLLIAVQPLCRLEKETCHIRKGR